MGYYHIFINDNTSNLCTIIIPREKYHYERIPMGISNSPDIFQQKMNDLFHVFEFIHAYIYEHVILTKKDNGHFKFNIV